METNERDLSMPTLTKINGEPKWEDIIQIHNIIYNNVSSITSKIEGGSKIIIILTIDPKKYKQSMGQWWKYQKPGNSPNKTHNLSNRESYRPYWSGLISE